MKRTQKLIEAIKPLEEAKSKEDAFQTFKNTLQEIGSEHLLVTAIPMPQKKLNGLVLYSDWPHIRTGKPYVPESSDIIIQKSIDWPAPFVLRERFYHTSGLAASVGLPRKNMEILVIPVITNFFCQGVVVTTFKREKEFKDSDSEHSMAMNERAAVSCLASSLFYKLKDLEALPTKREGELTAREREILSLSALGKKANEIKHTLNISERTVIAHLQNASMKLGASNRTECVLHAIRYNQIGPGAGVGFHQLENEIYPDEQE